MYSSQNQCEILAHKGSQTTRATPEDYPASWNCKPMGQRDFLASKTMGHNFPEKVTHWRHVLFFFISIARWSVKEDDTITSKVAKGKGKGKSKTCGKNGETGKCAEVQENESTDSFQNYDWRRLFMFLFQGGYLHKERKPVWRRLLC